MTSAQQLFERFRGLDRAHGQYIPEKEKRAGAKKLEGRAGTVREPLTVELWDQHLKGEYGIGVIPIMDSGNCWWGAIDIDNYSLDWKQLEIDLARLELPLVPCKTKSGGCHLYLFLKEESTAELVRAKLMEWAVALGHSGVEVFPKQTRLASRTDLGNWINMPYFGGDASPRHSISNGEPLSVAKFLKVAAAAAMTTEELTTFKLPEDEAFKDFLEEAPPCLQCLAKRGFGEGNRNKAMFNIGVYLRNRFGDDYADKMDQYNQKLMNPPLGHKEVAQITRNVGKKTYFYTCKDEPIVSVCNKQICLTRKYGIGGADDDPGVMFGELTKIKTDPPRWIWDVNGKRIELESDDILDQQRFRKICMNELDVITRTVKPATWLELLREKMERIIVVEVPADATQVGQVWILLEQFCTGNAVARAKEELLLGRPWNNPDDGMTYFSSAEFIKYLNQQRLFVKERELFLILRRRDTTGKVGWNIKGKFGNYWCVPAFSKQTEEFSVPKTDQETI